jgi:flagellar biosynthetic protein FlhB
MSDERTQPPSKRRRQLARQQGQVAHSPELTAAGGWLAAVVLLGVLSDDLAVGLTRLVRESLSGHELPSADPSAVVAQVRGLVLKLAWPLGVISSGFALGALAMHQVQVRGLWAMRLLAPDPARLWTIGTGPGLEVQAKRLSWSTVKAILLVMAAGWMIREAWHDLPLQRGLEGPMLAWAAGLVVLRLAWVLTAVLLVLGLLDYALQYRRFEAMLRSTPQEHREDQRVMEGDAAARAQRRRVARSWRGDSAELLAGASLLLCGPGGLTLILAGGPPPAPVTVRSVVRGNAALRLRRSSEASQLFEVDAHDLARRLARRHAPGSAVSAELIAELAAIWPASAAGRRA